MPTPKVEKPKAADPLTASEQYLENTKRRLEHWEKKRDEIERRVYPSYSAGAKRRELAKVDEQIEKAERQLKGAESEVEKLVDKLSG